MQNGGIRRNKQKKMDEKEEIQSLRTKMKIFNSYFVPQNGDWRGLGVNWMQWKGK